jgi:hypothetical protein
MLQSFEAARRVSVPIVVIRTADQFWTVERTATILTKWPLVQWDAANGMTPVQLPGVSADKLLGARAMACAQLKPDNTGGFVEAMLGVARLPQHAVCYVHNAHRQLQSAEPISVAASVQAVANLRDQLTKNFRMLVLLGPEGFVVPPELGHDVIALDHPLPGPEELAQIIREIDAAARATKPTLAKLTDEDVNRAVDASSGLSSFEAQQNVAMSYTGTGLDHDLLWERKRIAIEATPGLSVWRGKERFSDIIGQEAIKAKLRSRIAAAKAGRRKLGVVVWMDEIDKALANVEQDTSGVRMYQLLKLLTEMENNEWGGFIGVGAPGAGKSLIAKALGNEAGVPTIALDLGATESKYVGESEANLLRVLSVIKGMGNGAAYFVATSNAASVMRPELQRRFTDGMWMFDLMTDAERKAAWAFYIKRYHLPKQALPNDESWSGAEIRNCCRDAADLDIPLVEAAKTILPMAVSRVQDIEHLRVFANGKFLDANLGGSYQYDPNPMRAAVRAIELPPEVKAQVPEAIARAVFDESLARN